MLPRTVDSAGPGMNPRDGAPSAPRGRLYRSRGAAGRCPPHGAVLTVVRGRVVDGASWVICLDQVSGGHVFDLVRTGIYNSFGVVRKKKEDTLPMFVQETLGGPAAALAKAKTFGLF